MLKIDEARDMVDDIFEQEALLIGGILAVHGMEDELVWRLIRNLDGIRGRVMRKLDDREEAEPACRDERGAGPPAGARAGRCDDEGTTEKRTCLRADTHRQANLKPHPAIQDFLIKIRRESEWQKSASG